MLTWVLQTRNEEFTSCSTCACIEQKGQGPASVANYRSFCGALAKWYCFVANISGHWEIMFFFAGSSAKVVASVPFFSICVQLPGRKRDLVGAVMDVVKMAAARRDIDAKKVGFRSAFRWWTSVVLLVAVGSWSWQTIRKRVNQFERDYPFNPLAGPTRLEDTSLVSWLWNVLFHQNIWRLLRS